MEPHAEPTESPVDLTFVERAIIVRAIAAMRENDPDAAPTNAEMTQGHIALHRAMQEACAAGPGSRVLHNFGAMHFVYEVLEAHVSRIIVTRSVVQASYPSLPFQPIVRLPGVQITDQGDGTYVFDIRTRRADSESLAFIASTLASGEHELISEEEARRIGLLPPLEQ